MNAERVFLLLQRKVISHLSLYCKVRAQVNYVAERSQKDLCRLLVDESKIVSVFTIVWLPLTVHKQQLQCNSLLVTVSHGLTRAKPVQSDMEPINTAARSATSQSRCKGNDVLVKRRKSCVTLFTYEVT